MKKLSFIAAYLFPMFFICRDADGSITGWWLRIPFYFGAVVFCVDLDVIQLGWRYHNVLEVWSGVSILWRPSSWSMSPIEGAKLWEIGRHWVAERRFI
jgi:hypothetical protein